MDDSCVTRRNNYIHGSPFNKNLGGDGMGCFLYENFLEGGQRIFQVDGLTGESETYADVLKRSTRVALAMKSQGVTEDDVVVVCTGNTMDAFIPIFATQLLNATTACLDPSQSVRDVVFLLNSVEPKMIFVQDSALDLIESAGKEFKFASKIVVMGKCDKAVLFESFLNPHQEENDFMPTPLKDHKKTAIILFSSGTTGMPKGICVRGYSILTSIAATNEIDITGSVAFHGTSFYWISAFLVTLAVIMNKGRKVILPMFDVDTFFKAVQEHRIDYAMIPTYLAYDFNKENTSKYDLSSLTALMLCGTPVPIGLMQICRGLLPNAVVLSGYGLTEACGYAIVFPRKHYEEAKKHPSSIGVPQPGITIKIVDLETEEVLGPNQQGEVRISSKYFFEEYFKMDSSNAFDEEGFVKTGDVGYYDDNNYVYICDRIKDMFKYQSWHIVPASVEGVIRQHPAVKESVVIGIPHPRDGDHPMALVVLKEEFAYTDENDLIRFINERVLDREKLRGGLKILNKLPKTPSGKIRRAAVRKAVLEGSL